MASGSTPLTQFPPELKAIPCKPLFFDLALNHVELPDLSQETSTGTRTGLTGFVKGLWGGFGSK
jgi:signal recognition particle subunit SRP68